MSVRPDKYPRMPDMFEWDYLVKKRNTDWVARNDRGLTIAPRMSSNSGLQALINACIADKGTDPGTIMISPGDANFNINAPIPIDNYTHLQGVFYGLKDAHNWIYLENGSDCDMIHPIGGAGDDDIHNVYLIGLALHGNKDNNAGNHNCINWTLANAGGGSPMLVVDNVRVREADGHNIKLDTTTGAMALVKFSRVSSYLPLFGYNAIYTHRIFDSMFNDIYCSNWKSEAGFTSNVVNNVYLAGGDTNQPNMLFNNAACLETFMTNIRSDWCNRDSIVLENTERMTFMNTQVTQCKNDDDTYAAFLLKGTSKWNLVDGLTIGYRASRSVNKWKYAVEVNDTASENVIDNVNCGDGVATAEVFDILANNNHIGRVTREGGLVGRIEY